MDEPLIGLDPKAIKELKNLLLRLKNEGVSMIVSTHLLDSVDELWDRIIIMNKGTVVFSKTRTEFEQDDTISTESLEDIFFRVTEEGGK